MTATFRQFLGGAFMSDLLLLAAVIWIAAVGLILLFFHGASRWNAEYDRMSKRWLEESKGTHR